MPGGGTCCSVSSASASIERAPSGTACHDVSGATRRRARRHERPSPRAAPRRARARRAPRSPAAPSPARRGGAPSARARCGSRAPGRRRRDLGLERCDDGGYSRYRSAWRLSVTLPRRRSVTQRGLFWGAVGVVLFSFSLPAMRVAVEDLDATFVGLGRALVAAVLAGALLAIRREPLPDRARPAAVRARRHRRRHRVPAPERARAQAPLLRAHERRRRAAAGGDRGVGGRPRRRAASAGVLARRRRRRDRRDRVRRHAGRRRHRRRRPARARRGRARRARLRRGRRAEPPLRRLAGDLLGARADRAGADRARSPCRCAAASTRARRSGSCFFYVAIVSMFLAFFAWYHGLALGGVAKIGQVQLAQPVLTLIWSALLLAEQVTAAMVIAALAVLACVVATQQAPDDERGRRRALDRHRRRVQRRCAPTPRSSIPKTTTSWTSSPCRCHAVEHALAPEPDPLQRPLRAAVAGVRPRRQPLDAEPLERERRDHRLGLEVRARAPPAVPEPGADRRAPVAPGDLGQAGDADRPVVRDRRPGSRAARRPRAWPAGCDVAPRAARSSCTGPTRRSA